MTMKREIWSEKRHHTILAVPNVLGEDVFLEALRKVKNDYVRLTDAETLHLADMATLYVLHSETPFVMDEYMFTGDETVTLTA